MNERLTVRVNITNRVNAYAEELYDKLVPIFKPLVGSKVVKSTGELVAKIARQMPELRGTRWLMAV